MQQRANKTHNRTKTDNRQKIFANSVIENNNVLYHFFYILFSMIPTAKHNTYIQKNKNNIIKYSYIVNYKKYNILKYYISIIYKNK